MNSGKKDLIWADIKSWLITSLLMLSPLVLTEIIAVFNDNELTRGGTIVMIFAGMFLKLLQKWNQDNYYPEETK